jgi:hypothetical protein
MTDQARASTLLTVIGYQRPPRAVCTPRALRASAIAVSVVAPAFLISRMIGSTLAAWLPAAAPMVSKATFRAWASFRTAYVKWLRLSEQDFRFDRWSICRD